MTWWEQTYRQLEAGFMEEFAPFVMHLIVAILIFIVFWFIAVLIGKLVAEVLKKLRFNKLFEEGVWKDALEKADFKVDASGFIGAIVKWVLVIVALWLALGFMGTRFEGFVPFAALLEDVLAYLPNVIVAAFIFVVAVIVADLLGKIIRVAVESIKVGYGHVIEIIVKWAIIIFALLAILQQLEFAPADWIFSLIQIFWIGVVVAFALAFGLGGKNVAGEILENLYKKLKG